MFCVFVFLFLLFCVQKQRDDVKFNVKRKGFREITYEKIEKQGGASKSRLS